MVGVGDAVDSYNLNATFFKHKNVKVLGAIFNKLPLTGFYSLEACKLSVTQYFEQNPQAGSVYGFVPLTEPDESEGRVIQICVFVAIPFPFSLFFVWFTTLFGFM